MLSQMIERLKKHWWRRGAASAALAGGALLSGCAPVGFDPSRPPVTISGSYPTEQSCGAG